MQIELKVPALGESITEVGIGDWLKKEGDSVARDENLVMIESDKATVELPSPNQGRLTKILKQKGSSAAIGEVIGYLDDASSGQADASAPSSSVASSKPVKNDESQKAAPQPEQARVMPSAERILAQQGIKSESVEGTGPGGRILKEDALRKTSEKVSEKVPEISPTKAPETSSAPASPGPASPSLVTAKPTGGSRAEEVVPMTRLRRTLADRLIQAQHGAALLTTFNEIDMSGVMALRKEYQEVFLAKYKVKLGFMSFFVKAVIDGLKLVPQVNAEIRGTDVVYHNYFDVGVAVGGGKGLVHARFCGNKPSA